MRSWVGVLILLLLGSSAWGMTGNEWRSASEDARNVYISGVLDGWGLANYLDGLAKRNTSFGSITACLLNRDMTIAQIVAILDNYLKANPEQWNYNIASELYIRLSEICMDKP